MVAAALVAWALPASADIANDDCGSKEVGDDCEDFSGDTGICALDEDDAIYCDTSDEPAVDGGSGAGGSDAGDSGSGGDSGAGGSASKDDDSDCSVRNVGSGGRGELAALGGLLMLCIAFRKRIG